MVTSRRGATKLGCLLTLLIISAVLYFGSGVVEVYWRYYVYKDYLTQEVRFRGHLPDDKIVTHLEAVADSLGLPEEAADVTITRTGTDITIESEYDEEIELPLTKRTIHFHPRASRPASVY